MCIEEDCDADAELMRGNMEEKLEDVRDSLDCLASSARMLREKLQSENRIWLSPEEEQQLSSILSQYCNVQRGKLTGI
jgi:hypothetical protein